MRGTTVFNDSSCFVWFHAGLTHACNDNFSMIVRELSVSVSCEEFHFAVFIASCFILVPTSQRSHRCREFC